MSVVESIVLGTLGARRFGDRNRVRNSLRSVCFVSHESFPSTSHVFTSESLEGNKILELLSVQINILYGCYGGAKESYDTS